MNTFNDPTDGRTVVHGHGTGEITHEQIEQRAREIAQINGRSSDEVFADDRAAAREELNGHVIPSTSMEDGESIGELSRDPSNPPAFYSRSAPTNEGADEKKALERMVLEGVEEAQHDQMLEARRKRES